MRAKENETTREEGGLYLCATPIGNLGDMTDRVKACLAEADLIAAEDTRNTRRLLTHFEIHTRLTAYHEHNKYEKAEELLEMLRQGMKIALVTDAGTPAISDPGEVLVQRCLEEGIRVTSLPGACALITALTLSGKSARRFCFEGFLPPKKKEREEVLAELEAERRTLILYEAPHHLLGTLKDLQRHLGDRPLSLCRELTKLHEEVWPTTLEAAIAAYEGGKEPRGEYVLVLEGAPEGAAAVRGAEANAAADLNALTPEEHVAHYEAQGLDRKEALRSAARDRGMSRRDLYQLLLERGKE